MRRSAPFARTLSVTAVCAAVIVCTLFAAAFADRAVAFPGEFVWTQASDPTLGWDDLYFSAIGPGGTLYAVGNRDSYPLDDIWVVKYDAAGTQLWSQPWDGPDSNYDEARGMVVDAAGNVYVCGRTKRMPGSYSDTVVLKYDAAGALQWAKVWDAAGPTSNDEADAIGLDGAGNVYIAGYSEMADPAVTLWVAKYDPATGDRLWAADRVRTRAAYPRSLAVTPSGACYVAGAQQPATGREDALLWKVTGGGASAWARAWNGPRGGADIWHHVALTPKGGVIVAGTTHDNGAGDIAAASYTSSGTRRWARTWSSTGAHRDVCAGLAVTSGGGVWAVGKIDPASPHTRAAVVKWSASGTRAFAHTMGTGTTVTEFGAVVVDGSGNAFVAGSMDTVDAARQMMAAKYSPTGRLVWRTRSGWSAPSMDSLETICLGPAGYLYATGYAGWEVDNSRGVLVKIRR